MTVHHHHAIGSQQITVLLLNMLTDGIADRSRQQQSIGSVQVRLSVCPKQQVDASQVVEDAQISDIVTIGRNPQLTSRVQLINWRNGFDRVGHQPKMRHLIRM